MFNQTWTSLYTPSPPPRYVQSNLSDLDFTVQAPSPDMFKLFHLGPHCTEHPSVQPPPPPTFPDMKHIQLASEQLASYLNAFLLLSWLNSRLCVAWWLGGVGVWWPGVRAGWPGVIEPVSDPSGVHRTCMISFNNRHTIPERRTCTRMHVYSPANTPGLLTFTHLVLKKVFSLWIYDFSFCTSFWPFRFFRFSKKIKLR